MAQVNGLSRDRMLEIEGASIVDGEVDNNGNLILTKHNGNEVNAGSVIGPPIEINTPIKLSTAPPSSYPVGISVFAYGTSDATGFPATQGTVFTYLANVTRGYQMVTEKGAIPRFWLRNLSADNVWGDFREIPTIDPSTLTVTLGRVRITAVNDASETSTLHGLQIGPDDADNLILDNNEIMARTNGVGKKLFIGYGVTSDPATYTPSLPGDLITKTFLETADDTGWIAAGTAGFAGVSGVCSLTSGQVKRKHGVVAIQLTGVLTSALAAGNITNVNLWSIPTGWIPLQANGQIGSGQTGSDFSASAATSGFIVLSNNTVAKAAGETIQAMGLYMI